MKMLDIERGWDNRMYRLLMRKGVYETEAFV